MQRDRNDQSHSAWAWLEEDPTPHQKVHQPNQLSSRPFSAVLKSWSKSLSWIFFFLPSAGTSVIQVTALDADDATYGNSARVVYSILEGQPYFSVDPETGQWWVEPGNALNAVKVGVLYWSPVSVLLFESILSMILQKPMQQNQLLSERLTYSWKLGLWVFSQNKKISIFSHFCQNLCPQNLVFLEKK